MKTSIIDLKYLQTVILTDSDIIINLRDILFVFEEWIIDLHLGIRTNAWSVYGMYINGQLKNDGTIFFYNFIKTMQYCELNKIYYD